MNTKLQMIKAFTIFLLLFCSSVVIFSPAAKSGPFDDFYECIPHIYIDYNKSILEQLVIPYGEPTEFSITVKADIMGPAEDIVKEFLAKPPIKLIVGLSIENVPEGCYASVNPPLIEFIPQKDLTWKPNEANVTLSFTIDQYVPAFSIKNVRLNISAPIDRDFEEGGVGESYLGLVVKPEAYYFDIPFTVGYQPKLSFSYPKQNVKNISPDETAVFPIEIENWGNAQSNIRIEVEDVPKGWTANIVDNLTLATNLFGDEAKGTVSLNVKPPIDFGYYENRTIITVKMTSTTRHNNSVLEGEPHYLYFIVQSKGVSTALPSGSEMIFFIFASILIIFFVIYLIWKGKHNKEYMKKIRGKGK
ncbi:MAG: hypothetical protein R6V50_04725 [Thermoplasmatota archaeon]